MSTLVRWCRFNAVGAMGMVVQLAMLELLHRAVPAHTLVASAAAVEVTLLHNFAWHVRFTWRDRPERGAGMRRFLRFQMSNGVVSLLGNVALMALLAGRLHFPLLVANATAIVVCSAVNFLIGDGWAFRSQAASSAQEAVCHGRQVCGR